MAFRRKRTFRKYPRRGRPMARVRRTWVPGFTTQMCDAISIPVVATEPCDTTAALVVLVDNQTLQDKFSDQATVKRIVGRYSFQLNPRLDLAADQFEQYLRLANANAELFVGLRVAEQTHTDLPLGGSPAVGIDVFSTDDYSEMRWKRTWQHQWMAIDNFTMQVADQIAQEAMRFPVGTDDTHTHVGGTEACNELVTGSGFICIETDHTIDCEECLQPLATSRWHALLGAPRTWTLNFDLKKGISLRENQELHLVINYGALDAAAQAASDFELVMWGRTKVLLQY